MSKTMTHALASHRAEQIRSEEYPHMLRYYGNHEAALSRLADAYDTTPGAIEYTLRGKDKQ